MNWATNKKMTKKRAAEICLAKNHKGLIKCFLNFTKETLNWFLSESPYRGGDINGAWHDKSTCSIFDGVVMTSRTWCIWQSQDCHVGSYSLHTNCRSWCVCIHVVLNHFTTCISSVNFCWIFVFRWFDFG